MNENEQAAVEKLKLGLEQDKFAAWKEFGSSCINDKASFDTFAQMPAIVSDCGFDYRAGRVVTPDDVIAENKTIRIAKTVPDPMINFLYGSVGFGNRETPQHAAFYRIENLEVQERDYQPDDQGWQLYLPNGDLVTDNAFWLKQVYDTAQDTRNIAYLSPDARLGIFAHTKEVSTIASPTIPLIGRRNYFHFMIDQLPFIILAQHIGQMKGVYTALIRMYKFQRELCEVYGVNMNGVIELEKFTPRKNPNTFILKDAYTPAFIPLPERLCLLRLVLQANRLEKGTLKLFLSRKPSPLVSPRLTNQKELEDTLSANGFKIVYAEDYNVAQQKELFSKAKVVVGAHGAGLTNIMFAPRSALLIEIMNEVSHNNPMGICDGFRRICACNGQSYMRLVCPIDADSPQSREQDLHMTCKPKRVLNLVNAASDALAL